MTIPSQLEPREDHMQVPMEIDPPMQVEQKVYCKCQENRDEEMIGCDNEKCKYEWFHLSCVGLTKVPESNEWYCDLCK